MREHRQDTRGWQVLCTTNLLLDLIFKCSLRSVASLPTRIIPSNITNMWLAPQVNLFQRSTTICDEVICPLGELSRYPIQVYFRDHSISVGCREGGAAWGGDLKEVCWWCYGSRWQLVETIPSADMYRARPCWRCFLSVMSITAKVHSDHSSFFFSIPFFLDKAIAIYLCPGCYLVTEGDRCTCSDPVVK